MRNAQNDFVQGRVFDAVVAQKEKEISRLQEELKRANLLLQDFQSKESYEMGQLSLAPRIKSLIDSRCRLVWGNRKLHGELNVSIEQWRAAQGKLNVLSSGFVQSLEYFPEENDLPSGWEITWLDDNTNEYSAHHVNFNILLDEFCKFMWREQSYQDMQDNLARRKEG